METQASPLWPFTNISQWSLAELAQTSSSLLCVCWPRVSSIPPFRASWPLTTKPVGLGLARLRVSCFAPSGQARGSTWSQIHGRVGPGFGNIVDMQFCSLVSKKKRRGQKSISLSAHDALISLGKSPLVVEVEGRGMAQEIRLIFHLCHGQHLLLGK